jgi:hypothetical protein
MRRGALMVMVTIAALAVVPAASAVQGQLFRTVPVHVKPATGLVRSTFAVSLRIPAATGSTGGVRRTNELSVNGPQRAGCVSHAAMGLPAEPANTLVRMRLNPRKLGGRWCVGTFQGLITEDSSIICNPRPQYVCPELVIAPETIGKFKFRVKSAG